MQQPSVVIIGGGLAGLSAGCYARANGFRTQIIEHGELGGLCTGWRRGDYLIDGCIHWLTGGPFARVYEELGILPELELRPIVHFSRVALLDEDLVIDVTADLDALGKRLSERFPDDEAEVQRLIAGARQIAGLSPLVDQATELLTVRDFISVLWEMRRELPTAVHFRQPLGDYANKHIRSLALRRVLTNIAPPEAPAVFLLLMLGYLSRGWLSRPAGGSCAFRDALVRSYERLGGEARTHATVEEVLIAGGRACGVRLQDGSYVDADVVISTSSAPETVFQLLGGRYAADATETRLRDWKLFQPIVLASYGVSLPLRGLPQLLVVDGVPEFVVAGVPNGRLALRICNADDALGPPGHSVVQAIVGTDYAWWARCGNRYAVEKQRATEEILVAIDRYLPGVRAAHQVSDIATPLTYWETARSWRGAYEGWFPSGGGTLATSLPHRMPGLEGMYLAGQWVEPGGGIPMACSSGRRAVQVLCADRGLPFSAPQQ